MASDYASIKNDNVKRYGTDIGRIGPMLLANRYHGRAVRWIEVKAMTGSLQDRPVGALAHSIRIRPGAW